MGSPQKTLTEGVGRASGLVNTWRYWEGSVAQEDMGAPRPFQHTLPCGISSMWLFLSCIPYNKVLIVSKVLS